MIGRSESGRDIKRNVFRLLKSADFQQSLEGLSRLPARRVINPLFSFLHHGDALVKWRAVSAMGIVVARLAHEDMESARVIIRRLMWNLNDESGGIGWGSPEAMGEILARHKTLAEEYARILLSYARKDGNFQEHELMQRGVLWGIGRLCQTRPFLVRKDAGVLMGYLGAPDAGVRGTAAWVMGLLRAEEARAGLENLLDDGADLQLYVNETLVRRRVKELAREALERLPPGVQ